MVSSLEAAVLQPIISFMGLSCRADIHEGHGGAYTCTPFLAAHSAPRQHLNTLHGAITEKEIKKIIKRSIHTKKMGIKSLLF